MSKLSDLLDKVRIMTEENDTLKHEKTQTPEPVERKMRFDESGNEPGSVRDGFVRKGDKHSYGLEELAIGRMLVHARGSELPEDYETAFQKLAEKAQKRTMTTEGAGTGAELVDTILWTELFRDVRAATRVAQLFGPWVQMNSGKYELPELGDAVFYKPAGEGQAVTATDLATAKRALTAYTLKAQVDVSDEEDEDTVIGALSTIRLRLAQNASEVIDEMILNADASTGKQNVNYYAATGGSDISTASRFLVGFDGLIHYALNEVTGQKSDVGALDVTKYQALVSLLGKYGDNPTRCAFVIDRWVKNKSIGLDDFRTLDKMGAQATMLTGQVAQIYGVPVVLSGQIAKSNVTGQVDQTGGNNVKGRIVLVHRDSWVFGMRRGIRVAAQRDESKTLTSLVATMRIALQCLGDRSSATYAHTALGYNVTV